MSLASSPGRALRVGPSAGGEAPTAVGVLAYEAPAPGGPVLVVPSASLAGLRDAGYVVATSPTGLRVDLLVADEDAAPADTDDVVALVRRAAAAATLLPDATGRRLTAAGPSGFWLAGLVIWGWLLLLFAGQVALQVTGALWLVAGLPLARRAFRRRMAAWDRQGVAGLAVLAGNVEVRRLRHAGLARLAEVIAGRPEDPRAACREAAGACGPAGLAPLRAFYAALAAGTSPDGVWSASPPPAMLDSGGSPARSVDVGTMPPLGAVTENASQPEAPPEAPQANAEAPGARVDEPGAGREAPTDGSGALAKNPEAGASGETSARPPDEAALSGERRTPAERESRDLVGREGESPRTSSTPS